MRFAHSLALLGLALSGAAFAADRHEHVHAHPSLNGGVVAEANHLDFELVAQADAITLYVRDHGKPAGTQGATARLTLLNGTDKTEVALTPAGDNKLAARGSFAVAKGSKAVALVTMPGQKTSNVRFVLP